MSWERGRDTFDRLLIDGDPSINSANWLWLSASAFFHQARPGARRCETAHVCCPCPCTGHRPCLSWLILRFLDDVLVLTADAPPLRLPACHADPRPWCGRQFHRVYSPITFGKKYDPHGHYVRHFLPVLKVRTGRCTSHTCWCQDCLLTHSKSTESCVFAWEVPSSSGCSDAEGHVVKWACLRGWMGRPWCAARATHEPAPARQRRMQPRQHPSGIPAAECAQS